MQNRELTALGLSLIVHALLLATFTFIRRDAPKTVPSTVPFVQVAYLFNEGKATPLANSIAKATGNVPPSAPVSKPKETETKPIPKAEEPKKTALEPVAPAQLNATQEKRLWTKVIQGSRTLDRNTKNIIKVSPRNLANAKTNLKNDALALNADVEKLPSPNTADERGDLKVIQRRIQVALETSENATPVALPVAPSNPIYTRSNLLTQSTNLVASVRRLSAATTSRGRRQRTELTDKAKEIQAQLNKIPASNLRVERNRQRQIERNLATVLQAVNAPVAPVRTENVAVNNNRVANNAIRSKLLRDANALLREARNLPAATTQRGRTARTNLTQQVTALQNQYRQLPATNRRTERADNRQIERNIQSVIAATRVPDAPSREQIAQENRNRRQREETARAEAARQAENRRQREETTRAEAARQAESRRQREETARAEAARQAESRRQREETARAEAARQAESRRLAEEEERRRRTAPPPAPPRPSRITSNASVSGQLQGRAIVNRGIPQNTMGVNAIIEVIVSVNPAGEVVSHTFTRRGNAEAEAAVARVIRTWRFERLGRSEAGNQSGRITFRFIAE